MYDEHRFIVLRRVFLMLGLLYFYRAICFYVTVLPKADPQYYCSPPLNHTITFVELMQRCIRIISGKTLILCKNLPYGFDIPIDPRIEGL